MANDNNTDNVFTWQLTKTTVKERINHLYRNPLMADVYLRVANSRGGSRVTIPCHKFVLAVTSPVFYERFFGALHEPSEYIDLPECDSDGILEFLRYIYCDNLKFKKRRLGPVTKVLHLAKEYKIPSLTSLCRRFLEENINSGNVMDVLTMLHELDETHLFNQCCKIVDVHAAKFLQTDTHFVIEKTPLVAILRRDTLQAKETEIFQAMNCWAESLCERLREIPTGMAKRTIIGDDALKLVRFLLMSQKEFAEIVPDTGILTENEISQMFMYFVLHRKPGEFSSIPRFLNNRTIRRCKRFSAIGNFWRYDRKCHDLISFTVSVPVVFRGVRLFGCKGGRYFVQLVLSGAMLVENFFLSEETVSDGYYGYDVIFEQWYELRPEKRYNLLALIKGPKSSCGLCGKEKVVCKDTTFRFHAPYTDGNGSTFSKGQFAEILFADI